MAVEFFIVDTFSDAIFEGHPVAVFVMDSLENDVVMQNIAMEINTPESIFLKELPHGDFEVACFSPVSKGVLFGNGLFAASHVVHSMGKCKPFNLISGDRIFPVELHDDEIKIRFSSVSLSRAPMPASLHDALGGEIVVSIAEHKDDIIIEIRSPKKMFNLSPNFDILKTIDYRLFILTADTHYETDVSYDFCAKIFSPSNGMFFDVASPIAHVKLAAYWASRMEKTDLVGYQESGIKKGYSKISYSEDYTYISCRCVITTKGEIFT